MQVITPQLGLQPSVGKQAIRQFLLCVFTFETLLLSSLFGTLAIVAYISPWIVFFVLKWNRTRQALFQNWPLLMLPFLGLLSSVWSNERLWTVKASLELAITMTIGIIIAKCMRPRVVMAALMVSMLMIAIISVVTGLEQLRSAGDEALQGIYESKNAFSAVMSLLLLTSIVIYLDKGFGQFTRLIAAFGILFAPLLLYYGRSVGAIVASLLTVIIFFYMRFLARLPAMMRLLAIVFMASVCTLLLLTATMTDFNPMSILGMVGKDTSLTGRTYLWSRAVDFIGQRPLLGVGYRSFWRLGNPGAEDLWYNSHVERGAGFNFHNEYLEMLVENGIVGLLLMLGYMTVLARRIIAASFRRLSAKESFAALMFICCMMRTPLEVSLFNQFNIITIIFCLIWVYSKPSENEDRPRKTRENNIAPLPSQSYG